MHFHVHRWTDWNNWIVHFALPFFLFIFDRINTTSSMQLWLTNVNIVHLAKSKRKKFQVHRQLCVALFCSQSECVRINTFEDLNWIRNTTCRLHIVVIISFFLFFLFPIEWKPKMFVISFYIFPFEWRKSHFNGFEFLSQRECFLLLIGFSGIVCRLTFSLLFFSRELTRSTTTIERFHHF